MRFEKKKTIQPWIWDCSIPVSHLRDLRSTCKMKHSPNCGAWAVSDWATPNQPPSKLVLRLRRGDGVHNYGSEANEQKPSSLGCFCFWSLPSDLELGRIKEPCGVPGTKDLGTTLKSRHPGRGGPKGRGPRECRASRARTVSFGCAVRSTRSAGLRQLDPGSAVRSTIVRKHLVNVSLPNWPFRRQRCE